MSKRKSKVEYKDGKVEKLWDFLCKLHEINPNLFSSPQLLRNTVAEKWKELGSKKHCPNCHASMKIDVYKPDMLDAVLLISMAKVVKENIKNGMSFTEANLVHVPSLKVSDGVRHRTTRCSYLNYVKQPMDKKNTGMWLITTWGWKALRNGPVPKKVKYFRGKMIEDSREGTITLSEMMKNHIIRVEDSLKRGKQPKSDQREYIKLYNPTEWTEDGGLQQGLML